jgi:hypothetical protein
VVDRHIADGRAVVASVTGEEPGGRILLPPAGIDSDTLAQARRSGVDTVVLPEQLLSVNSDSDFSPSPVRRLRVQGSPVTALVPDPWLGAPLVSDAPDGPVVAAQRVMAEIASVYFEVPGTPRRGLLIAPPPGELVPPQVLDALTGPLAQARFVRTTPLSQLERRVQRSPDSVSLDYSPVQRAAELPSTFTIMLTNARRALGSLAGVLEDGQGLPTRLDGLLLQSVSVHYRGEALPQGRDLLRAVSGTVTAVYDAVDVLDSPPVTLTDVEGLLPVSIRSTAEVPLRVRVSLESARYDVEGGSTRALVLQPGRIETLTFRVTALSPGGTSPVQVVVRDAAGDLDLAQSTVVVRSTAFSVAGAMATAGAGAILLLFALSQVARRRTRSRIARSSAADGAPLRGAVGSGADTACTAAQPEVPQEPVRSRGDT